MTEKEMIETTLKLLKETKEFYEILHKEYDTIEKMTNSFYKFILLHLITLIEENDLKYSGEEDLKIMINYLGEYSEK